MMGVGTGIHAKADAAFAASSRKIWVPRRLPLSARIGSAFGLRPPAEIGCP